MICNSIFIVSFFELKMGDRDLCYNVIITIFGSKKRKNSSMKILVGLIFMMLSTVSGAQVWFDLGVKGGVGSGFLLNKTLNSDGRFGVSPGFNYFYGGKFGVNFGEAVGITFDVDYGSYVYAFTQAEVPGKSNTEVYTYKLGYKALNLMPAFRFTKEASYLEIGPTFSFTKKAFVDDESNLMASSTISDFANPKLIGATFGFGGHMIGNEVISLMMGLRFNYIFSNITADTYQDTNFPFTNYPTIMNSAKTTPINVQLTMEINYSLGYFVTASCGRRTAFLTF